MSGIAGTTTRRGFLVRSVLTGGFLVVSPAVLAACAGSPGASDSKVPSEPVRGGAVTFARTADVQDVDPSAVSDNESIWIVSNLYDRLYQSAADGTSVPSLATGHTVSADKLTWTFTLQPGVRFSDGSALTAADAKFSIDRCTKSDANGYINVAIESVDAPDDHTVVIKTKYPTELLGVVSYYANGILPNNLQGQPTKQFFTKPVGTGAFSMTSWQVGQELLLSRNPNYWQSGKPYLDQITVSAVADDNTRILQLRGKQAEIIEAPPWSQISSLKAESGIDVHIFPSSRVDFLCLNTRVAPLADVNVRNAMALAIDRDSIVKVALFGNGQAAGSMFAPTWPDYDSSIAAPARDLAGAKALLAKSKFASGFEIKHSVDSGDTTQGAVAQIIQSNLADIGIRVSIEQFDSNTLATMVNNKDFQMFQSLLSLDIMDPFENVPYLVDPAAGGDSVWGGYEDPEVLAWTNEAQHTTDPAVQASAYQKVQQRLHRDSPFIPLYYTPYVYATSNRVQGFTVPPTGDFRLEQTWLAS